ncbi:MAG: hypothetical protein CAPSK01_002658 [Candidatus Accumulibacter vicinus]|uniref:Uncharacterized protein n=1 Tax=Candidatus Accumulibacter vicinus TaxID=2954382 RepID=A0A084Y022_9PROT|nr:MAG: hypothetical protein CAPSK01_002658 [Candidatus Accumulibacter vicinus]
MGRAQNIRKKWACCKPTDAAGIAWRQRLGSEVADGPFWHDRSVESLITAAMTNDSTPFLLLARRNVVQHKLIPELGDTSGSARDFLTQCILLPLHGYIPAQENDRNLHECWVTAGSEGLGSG